MYKIALLMYITRDIFQDSIDIITPKNYIIILPLNMIQLPCDSLLQYLVSLLID